MIDAYRRWRYTRLLADTWRVHYAMRNGHTHYAYPLSRITGLRLARIYRALTRLEQEGHVHTGWEDKPVRPRRWYMLTAEGSRAITPQVIQ